MINRPLIFNHHALPYPTCEQAKADLPDFTRTAFLCCQRYACKLILLDGSLDPSWRNIKLAPGYYWRDWLEKDSRSDQENRRAFLSLTTRSPLMLDGVGLECEVGLPGQQTNLTALQAAFVHQTYLLSLPNRLPWNQAEIEVWVTTLTEDGLISSQQQLPNVCGHESLEYHAPTLANLKQQGITGGLELWEHRTGVFPHLKFLPKPFGNQLRRGNYRADVWHKARHALEALNRFAEAWQANRQLVYQSARLADYGMSCEVSGESASTLQNAKTRAAREFWLPTGEKVCFSEHAKLTRDIRLHFYPDAVSRQLYIGYLGPHLPI
ncbi:MAG: hypothetical protein AAF669_07555 [Pseudomonadota bacterium]